MSDRMTLTIQLRAEQEAALKAKAASRGVTSEEYARQILDWELRAADEPRRQLSEVFREIWGDVPDDVRAQFPVDGPDQIDHYVYGVPKKDK